MTRSLPAIAPGIALVAAGASRRGGRPAGGRPAALRDPPHDRGARRRRYFKEVEWDDDGYWEVEFYRTDGSEVEVDIDPWTGEPRG
jgi:hypothetical protein